MKDGERWSKNTKSLKHIPVGSLVLIQNQTGNNPKRWDKTGVVVENKDHSQLLIKVDGSRRLTLRNRQFVRPLVNCYRKIWKSDHLNNLENDIIKYC